MSNPCSRRDFLKVAGLVVGAGASSSFLSSCGGGEETTTTSGATATSGAGGTTPAASGEALKIGVILPFSQVYAVLGESIVNGMELYFSENGNQAGGRPITLINEDEEASPDVGLRKVRKLVEQDNVDLLTGFVSTAVAYACRNYIDDNEVVTLVSNAGGNDLTRSKKSDYIFRTSFTSWQVSNPAGKWIAENVSKKAFTMGADYAFGRESVAAFLESFTAAGGTQIGEVWPKLGSTDYSSFLTKIKQAKPEVVYGFFSGSDAVSFVKQFGEFGLKDAGIKLAGAGFMVEEDVLPAQGAVAEGAYSPLHWCYTLDNPENTSFVTNYKAKYGKVANVFAVQGYDTARCIVEALGKTGGDTEDKEALISALEGVAFASPRGSFKFDPESNQVIQDIYMREVKTVDGVLHNTVLATIPGVQDQGA